MSVADAGLGVVERVGERRLLGAHDRARRSPRPARARARFFARVNATERSSMSSLAPRNARERLAARERVGGVVGGDGEHRGDGVVGGPRSRSMPSSRPRMNSRTADADGLDVESRERAVVAVERRGDRARRA